MELMTLEEYKRIVAEHFRELCKAYPKEEVEAYLKEQEQEIERSYWIECNSSKKRGVTR